MNIVFGDTHTLPNQHGSRKKPLRIIALYKGVLFRFHVRVAESKDH